MALHTRRPTRDPAADAAVLLRRIGFGVLVLGAPIAAVLSRRGLVIAMPLGVALLVLARFLESDGREPLRRLSAALRRRSTGIAAFLLFWAGLSLIWTPFPAEASEQWASLAINGVVALLGVAAVPQRMRASNLYLLPIGCAGAALVALLYALRAQSPALAASALDQTVAERALLTLVVLAPSAIAWLHSRQRSLSAVILLGVTALAAILFGAWPALAALAVSTLVYLAAGKRLARTRDTLAVVLALLVAAAPVLPFLMRPLAKLLLGGTHPRVEAIRIWCRLVSDDPLRLITGHGLDTALRAVNAGLVPAGAPRGLLFEIWYELGFLGALALALLLISAVRATRRLEQAVAPGALATIAGAFTIAMLGLTSAQSWWLVSLGLAAITLVAVNQGQFRTVRPKSRIVAGKPLAQPR
jgi:hypothetical protein